MQVATRLREFDSDLGASRFETARLGLEPRLAAASRARYYSAMNKRVRAESREGMRVTTVALQEDMHRRLAIAAIEESTVMTELVRRALAEWLDRRGRKRRGSKRP